MPNNLLNSYVFNRLQRQGFRLSKIRYDSSIESSVRSYLYTNTILGGSVRLSVCSLQKSPSRCLISKQSTYSESSWPCGSNRDHLGRRRCLNFCFLLLYRCRRRLNFFFFIAETPPKAALSRRSRETPPKEAVILACIFMYLSSENISPKIYPSRKNRKFSIMIDIQSNFPLRSSNRGSS